MKRMRLERHVHRSAADGKPLRLRIPDRIRFSMRTAEFEMSTFADHITAIRHDHAAHQRIRADPAHAFTGERQGLLHVIAIGHTDTITPCRNKKPLSSRGFLLLYFTVPQ